MTHGRTLHFWTVMWREIETPKCHVVEVLAAGPRSAIRGVKRDLRILRQRGKAFKARKTS